MAITIGEVATFPDVQADKEQCRKILEESAEVFGAWQRWHAIGKQFGNNHLEESQKQMMLDECADVITSVANLIAACGIADFTPYMAACEQRNHERGRL